MARAWYAMRKSVGARVFTALNYTFMILLALSMLYPFWTTLLLSFSPVEEATALGLKIWISNWSTDAYRFAFSRYGRIGVAYGNSIFRTVIGTSVAVILTLAAAYPLSKKRLPGRNLLTIVILITMFFSGGMVPTYLVVRTVGLANTRWALILPAAVGGFYVIIVRNFLMTIDNAYEEAAFIDGANYLQVLLRVVIPLAKPVIATIVLWTAVGHWNAWFDALLYISSESKLVLQLLLRRMIRDITQIEEESLGQFEVMNQVQLPSEAVKGAITILTIGPIILIYPFLQRYFIKGIFVGSLKG